MASNPHQILLSKAKHLTREYIESLSDREAWGLIYSLPKVHKPTDNTPTICFTGFGGSEDEDLLRIAENNGFKVVQSVVKRLTLLCTGATPGPVKMRKAAEQGTRIITADQLRAEANQLKKYLEQTEDVPISPEIKTYRINRRKLLK